VQISSRSRFVASRIGMTSAYRPIDRMTRIRNMTAAAHTESAASDSEGDIELTFEESVAWVRLNRPSRRNAVTDTLVRELCRVLTVIRGNDEVHSVVLAGNGKAFCAGHDLKE